MKINYVTVTDATMASYRYRILLPSVYLRERGHMVNIGDVCEGSDVTVFSKHFDETDYWKAYQCKDRGSKVVFDVCDLHEENHNNHYTRMMDIADRVTTSTDELSRILNGRNAITVPDPYEYPEAEAKFLPAAELKILWYGHASNLPALINVWHKIRGNYVLILTNPEVKNMINVPIVEWSIERQKQGLSECDVVIVPIDDIPKKRCKSPNRLIEAVRSGRFVVASDIPSHREFKDFIYIGDIGEGIEWVKSHRDEVLPKIKAGQDYIREKYSPKVIAKQWEDAFDFGQA